MNELEKLKVFTPGMDEEEYLKWINGQVKQEQYLFKEWERKYGVRNIPLESKPINGSINTKPIQLHHYATNKSKTYTPQLEEVAKKYDLKLDDAWNKDLLPHQGRHPNEYHEYILDSMKQFDDIAQGDKDIFLILFEGLKEDVKNNPDKLYKNYWK